jgi:hypothetical protein
MTWSGSAMFREWPAAVIQDSGTGWDGLDTDVIKAALFDTTPTPDKDAALASTGYNTGQWVTSDEVSDGTNWDAGGEPLTGKAVSTPSSGVVMFDATDTPQSGASTTLAGVFGCLVYDDDISGGTVAKQGVSFHYFGGSQSVTAGTFTIVWHANGLFRITV